MRIIAIIFLFCLAACSTPKTILVNHKTGQVQTCGGEVSTSVVGNLLGHQMQKAADNRCVSDFQEQGFKIEKQDPQ